MIDFELQTRRTLLKRAGIVGGAVMIPGVLQACGSGSGGGTSTAAAGGEDAKLASHVNSSTVVWSDYGGALREARQRIYYDSFTQQTGANVAFAEADGAQLVLQAESGHGSWDGYDADGFELIDYYERGLLQKLPPWVPRSDMVAPKWRDVTSGGFAYNFCQAYNAEELTGRKPETWADFWDTEKFPGKRAFPQIYIGTAEPALLADGVPPDQVYPLDLDRAFAKMSELRDDMLLYESYSQAEQMLTSGAAVMGLLPNGRVFDAQQRGAPQEIVWNEAILLPWEGPIVPTSAPHADTMFALMGWMADPKRQAELAKATSYAPTVSKAYEFIDDKTADNLANSPDHKAIAFEVDAEALAKQNEEYSEGFTKWLSE